jgi:hypothetical protein
LGESKQFIPLPILKSLTQCYRRIIWAHTTSQATTIEADIPSLVTRHFAVHIVRTRGGRRLCTTCSSTTHEQSLSWGNLELDSLHGFHVEKFVDLPHKRSAFVRCSRERYFGLCTVGQPWAGKKSVQHQGDDGRQVKSKL